jgi:hypothetical protein
VTASTSVFFVAKFSTVAPKETSENYTNLAVLGEKKRKSHNILRKKKVTWSHLDK